MGAVEWVQVRPQRARVPSNFVQLQDLKSRCYIHIMHKNALEYAIPDF